ncbi:MAG: hypothetical protein GY697_10320 [Desulfobacterales bacterium]|nr:hypothetical protein [Desulfobacterales bacterium]
MQKKTQQPVSIVSLIRSASRYTGGSLPCNYQSYPVPFPTVRGLWVAFLYAKAEIVEPQQGLCIKPPQYIAFYSAQTGRFEELKQFQPQEYGLPAAADEWIGRCLTPAERMAPEFLTEQIKLYQFFDDLLPPFSDDPPRTDAGTPAAAAAFKEQFDRLAEQPLMPHYKGVGSHFFKWLKKISASK